MLRMITILFLCSTLAAACLDADPPDPVQQTTQEAVAEMCYIPVELQSDPASIGPYMAERIFNPEVIQILRTLKDAKDLHEILEKHDYDPQSCDLVTMLSKAD